MAEREPAVQALCLFHGDGDPEALILRLCRELLGEQPSDAGPTPLPVLGSCRCIRKVVSRSLARRSGCSGILTPLDGGYVVALDEAEPPGRQRRSLAHEIVHTFFREVSSGPAGREEERLCELGAAELTMPLERIGGFLGNREIISFDLVNECASEFEVTNDAAARRLVELSPRPVCYLVARVRRTRRQEDFGLGRPRLRVASWALSSSWPDRRPYLGLAFEPASLVAQAFEAQDLRGGRSALGTTHRDGVYDIEAVGYMFPLRGEPRRQVAVLVRGITP